MHFAGNRNILWAVLMKAKEVIALNKKNAPIGVFDSGVGGLTVARSLRRQLPGEQLIYIGDSANCPYGNRSEDEIFSLAMNMVRALEKEGAKCIVIACNTISATVERIRRETDTPIFSVVESTVKYVADMGETAVGLAATEYTVGSGIFHRSFAAFGPEHHIVGEGSPTLAALVDSGRIDTEETEAEISRLVSTIQQKEKVGKIILGCTHYPIVVDKFQKYAPGVEFIDESEAQAQATKKWLIENDILREGEDGSLSIRTSGKAENFRAICDRLNIPGVKEITEVEKI